MRRGVCVCVDVIYIYMFLKHSFSFHQGFLCCWRVPRGYTVDISTDHARALQQVHTNRDMSRPLHHHHHTPHGTPETSCQTQVGTKHRNCLFWKLCLWFHIYIKQRLQVRSAWLQKFLNKAKQDTIDEGPREEHKGTSQSSQLLTFRSVLCIEYVHFCGLQWQSFKITTPLVCFYSTHTSTSMLSISKHKLLRRTSFDCCFNPESRNALHCSSFIGCVAIVLVKHCSSSCFSVLILPACVSMDS